MLRAGRYSRWPLSYIGHNPVPGANATSPSFFKLALALPIRLCVSAFHAAAALEIYHIPAVGLTAFWSDVT